MGDEKYILCFSFNEGGDAIIFPQLLTEREKYLLDLALKIQQEHICAKTTFTTILEAKPTPRGDA